MVRRESGANVRHLLQIPQATLLRWYSDECPGTSKCKTLFMLGEDAGSCLRIISSEGNRYNKALLGYVLQSHVRALVVCDDTGRVRAAARVPVHPARRHPAAPSRRRAEPPPVPRRRCSSAR